MSDDITISNPDPSDDASRLIGEEAADVSSAGTDETLDVADLLDAVAKERDEFKDLALRLQADFENFRKRVAIQLGDDVDRATGKIVESILPVLDACEAAAAHGVQGIESVWSALLGSLQKQGLEALDLADKPFDPSTAEAVVHEPGSEDGTGPVVSEVLRTGYRWKGRVVRAAMVKVKG
jgi:molecular chaperone GrpE